MYPLPVGKSFLHRSSNQNMGYSNTIMSLCNFHKSVNLKKILTVKNHTKII